MVAKGTRWRQYCHRVDLSQAWAISVCTLLALHYRRRRLKDVLQESFIKIFTSLDSFKYRGEGSLKAWMAKITLNEILKFVRNNSRLPIDSIDDKDMNIADGDSMETEDIPTDVLHQFIRELPDGYRTVFNLYVIDDKNHKEIAQLLGIKENTSASQLHKAKSMLAQKIKHYRTINSI